MRWPYLTVLVCGVLASATVAGSALHRGNPRVEDARVWFDPSTKHWRVMGTVRFPRGGNLILARWRRTVAFRSVQFDLSIPGDWGLPLTTADYNRMAIASAEEGAGEWQVEYVNALTGWLICWITYLAAWWVVMRVFAAHKLGPPNKSLLQTGRPDGSLGFEAHQPPGCYAESFGWRRKRATA
jgi:hypothetical protein